MKKQYKQPELYVENVIVEQGIATSTVTLWWENQNDDPFGLGEDTTYEETVFGW